MAVKNFFQRRPGEPEVMVELVVDGRFIATGFIDARQQSDDVWEAYVDYSYTADNGFPSHRRDWFPMNDLKVLAIDDEPPTGPTP